MREYPLVTKEVEPAVAAITSGRVVAFPTGTSYGLAVDALQGHALQRLRNLKGRNVEKTFTIFLREELWDAYAILTDAEKTFLRTHAGKPVTLLVKPTAALAHIAQENLIGLRCIDHPVMEALAQAVDVPLTATSANSSGQPACYDTACIQTYFPGLLDPQDTRHGDIERAQKTTYDLSLACILDGGMLTTRGASTILKLTNTGTPNIIRQGNFTLEA